MLVRPHVALRATTGAWRGIAWCCSLKGAPHRGARGLFSTPERLADLFGDLSARDAGIVQQAIIELGERAALPCAIGPVHDEAPGEYQQIDGAHLVAARAVGV